MEDKNRNKRQNHHWRIETSILTYNM